MSILPDWQIRRDIVIEPFDEGASRPGVISYGLSSYGYRGQPGYIYGPYFGRAVWKLYSKAQRVG